MDTYSNPFKRKLFLSFPIILNIGLLCYFKYFNFFIETTNNLLDLSLDNFTSIILPIGISFYTFESVTYSVDVYRKIHKPLNRFWDYQMYIIFFPKLIAGPIVRYHEIADQLQHHIYNETFNNRLNGFIRFSIGLSKKVIIANVVGSQADAIFLLNPEQISTSVAWVGALAYTLQIYFDFSGYSDMAIGISKMLGFNLPENFNNPYTSKSITEFWRRWHITLGSWMKNYLYIPLGGNRTSKGRIIINLFIVFVLSGLWHGAGWNFVLWGIYYGIFLVIERLIGRKENPSIFISLFGWIYTFIVVIIGWVLFRIESIDNAFDYISRMFAFNFENNYVFIYNADFILYFIFGLIFSFSAFIRPINTFQDKLFGGLLKNKMVFIFTILAIAFYFICILLISDGQANPFIYFKF